jgi:hypothetical protein
MRDSILHPRLAAIVALLLCLPLATLMAHVALGIEPDFGPLRPLLTAAGGRAGSFFVIGLMLLLPVAFAINLAPLKARLRAGYPITEHKLNLVLAIAIVGLFAAVAAAFVVDQYPCWIGVPNCD